MSFQAGFVSIIGKPNVGKSTLLNALLGEKLSIISQKAQTTRHRIKGILNAPEYQIVFSDTPGIINPKYKLQGNMMKFVNEGNFHEIQSAQIEYATVPWRSRLAMPFFCKRPDHEFSSERSLPMA